MRRKAVAALAALGVALLPEAPALAAPSSPPATPGKAVCQMTEGMLSNLTGLATTSTGYATVESTSQSIYLLDGKCKRVRTLKYPAQARSPQDLTVAADGTLWVADTGDADVANPRDRIALWKIPASGARGTIYRFTYPGGAHFDARAMVMAGGLPIFVTKVANGAAGLYTPSGALNPAGAAVPLKKVGEFTPQHTGTNNPLGALGNSIVTGGATSPDGKKVVLRTYSDAYEWSVTGDDVAGAISGGTPTVTPLPDEAAGEAITFTRDGQFFLTASNATVDTAHPDPILRYTPVGAGTTAGAGATTTETGANGGKADTRNWWDKLTLQQITYLVAAVGVIGLLMVVGGILGIRRARSQRRKDALAAKAMGRPSGAAAVPGAMAPPPAERQYDPYGPADPYGPGDSYGPADSYGQDYPPQGYRPAPTYESPYDDGYDQGPPQRQQGGGTYQSGTYQGGGYGAPPPPPTGTTYGRPGPPRGRTYPPGPDAYDR